MARIRSLKPELLEDEKTANLDHLEWRVFVSTLLMADDYGNFRATPARVRGTALWAHPDADIDSAMTGLSEVGLLRLYTVDGQLYGHVIGWSKHQKVDHPGKPTCPGPDSTDSVDLHPTREGLASVSEDLAPDQDGIGEEGKGSFELAITPSPKPAASPVLVFPCSGAPREWPLTKAQVALWQGLYPAVAVESECRKALAWTLANAAKKKTAGGMPRFLVRWLGRVQDDGRGQRRSIGPPLSSVPADVAAERQRLG